MPTYFSEDEKLKKVEIKHVFWIKATVILLDLLVLFLGILYIIRNPFSAISLLIVAVVWWSFTINYIFSTKILLDKKTQGFTIRKIKFLEILSLCILKQ